MLLNRIDQPVMFFTVLIYLLKYILQKIKKRVKVIFLYPTVSNNLHEKKITRKSCIISNEYIAVFILYICIVTSVFLIEFPYF